MSKTTIHNKLRSIYLAICEDTPPENAYTISGKQTPTILRLDRINRRTEIQGDRCDDFVILDIDHSKTGIYVIERKNTAKLDVADVIKQLKGGVDFIDLFVRKYPELDGELLDIMLIIVSKNKFINLVNAKLVNAKVRQLKRQIYQAEITSSICGKKEVEHVYYGDSLPPMKN